MSRRFNFSQIKPLQPKGVRGYKLGMEMVQVACRPKRPATRIRFLFERGLYAQSPFNTYLAVLGRGITTPHKNLLVTSLAPALSFSVAAESRYVRIDDRLGSKVCC